MGMSTYQRCGFFASSAYQRPEECTSKVALVDDKDYVSSFYAALIGQTREGEPLAYSPDLDKNGQVSLREAHLSALEYTYSTSLARSTSEAFLENWQPWYTKWHSSSKLPDNEYGRLAQRLAKHHNVTDSTSLLTQRAAVQFSLEALANRLAEQDEELNNLQIVLKARLSERWPALATPYTDNYRQLLLSELPVINQFILQQPEYAKLVTQHQDKENLKARILDTKRQLSQYEKIRRMRKLARLLESFKILGNDVRQREYQRLLDCESVEPSAGKSP